MPPTSHAKVKARGSTRSRLAKLVLTAVVLLGLAASCLAGEWPRADEAPDATPSITEGAEGAEPPTVLQPRSARTFVFSAAGDYGASSEAAATLEAIGRSEAAFHVALGDLSYGQLQPETAWCEFVRSRVGDEFPFQLLAGNHDSDGEAAGQHIEAFRECLPNRLEGVVGRYGEQYYFDYPPKRPLARFILVAPGFVIGGTRVDYLYGDPGYRWVADAIEKARAEGIRWIVVGSHAPCLTVGEYGCSMGEDLFNLLVDRRVDLILSGHEHSYQRTVQLKHNAVCPIIRAGEYDERCVSDDASDGQYTKGLGTVQIVAGAAGAGLYDVDLDQPEGPYMAAVMGAGVEPTNGLVELMVSPRALTGRFLSSTGGTFTDSFAILRGGDAAQPPPALSVVTLVEAGAEWRYWYGSAPPEAWEQPEFDDSEWDAGRAELGYGDDHEATTLDYGEDADDKPPTAYFRTSFEMPDPAGLARLRVRLRRDDGAVVYLNGIEVMRSNMPAGTVTYDTFAAESIDDRGYQTAEVDGDLLVPGTNVVAVEVHQSDEGSSDLTFDLALTD